jgi:hypothetical protein
MIWFIATSLQLQTVMTPPFLTGLRVSFLLRDWLGSDLRIGHFFSFRCPLVNTPYLNTQLLNCIPNSLTNESLKFKVKVKVMLRTTVSLPVCLSAEHPFGAYDQILIIVWQLRVCWFQAPSLTRGRVCRLHLLLVLASVLSNSRTNSLL